MEEMKEGRWFQLRLPWDDAEYEEFEPVEPESQSARADLRCGDMVVLLNTIDDELTFQQETQHLLFIAVFQILFKRKFFPLGSFQDVFVPSLDMRIKVLLAEEESTSFPLVCFLKGVYASLEDNVAKQLWIRVVSSCLTGGDKLDILEEYAFIFDEDVKEEGEAAQQGFKSRVFNMFKTIETLLGGLKRLPRGCIVYVSLLINAPTEYKPRWFKDWEIQEEFNWSFKKMSIYIQRQRKTTIEIQRFPVCLTLHFRTLMPLLRDSSHDGGDEGPVIVTLKEQFNDPI